MDESRLTRRDVSAAVLAGGASRRMGSDKALLTIDGQTLLERAIAVVAAIADDVTIVGDREAYHRFGAEVIGDVYPGAGALGGVLTGLLAAQHEFVLVVACDMPFLSPILLAAMADQPRDYDVLLPVTSRPGVERLEDRTCETLHAVYRRRCIPEFERRIANGELRIASALSGLSVRELNDDWLRRYDPDLVSFVNTNDPAEFDSARARIATEPLPVEDQL